MAWTAFVEFEPSGRRTKSGRHSTRSRSDPRLADHASQRRASRQCAGSTVVMSAKLEPSCRRRIGFESASTITRTPIEHALTSVRSRIRYNSQLEHQPEYQRYDRL